MSRSPRIFVLPSIVEAHLPSAVYGSSNDRWSRLAHVVARNLTSYPGPVRVVLSPEREQKLAVVGWFTDEEARQFTAEAEQFTHALPRLRYVSYEQAESDCAVLADRLRDRLGSAGVRDAVFAGIPRGGLLVLGMLSYVLDLTPDQLSPKHAPDRPLVVVDDCFITGSRVGRFLDNLSDRSRVTLAGLYAHPDLSNALEEMHPAVNACIHARDLSDYAPELYGEDYPAWRARWTARSSGHRYWYGVTDRLCFAWSEPDSGWWNPTTQRTERNWSLLPKDRCLDGRNLLSDESSVPVFVQDASRGEVKMVPGVVYASFSDQTIVGHPEQGTCLVLEETAADFWRVLVEHADLPSAQSALAELFDVESRELHSDLHAFVDTLIEKGLLQRSSTAPPVSP